MKVSQDKSLHLDEIENIGLCCIFESKLSKIPLDEMKEILRITTINGENALTLIESVQQYQGIGTRWLKSLLSHPTTLERTYRKMTICPSPVEGIQGEVFNTRKVLLKVNRVSENNNFRFGDNRGTFVRSGTVIISISVNFTSLRDLKHTLATIGSYIGWEFQNTKGRTLLDSEKEIYNKILEAPHKFIGCTLKQWGGMNRETKEQIGILSLNEGQEYMTTGTFLLEIDENWNLRFSATQQTIAINITGKEIRPFSESVYCPNIRMVNHFNTKRTIKHMFSLYMENYPMLLKKIQEGDFKWKNLYLNKFMPQNAFNISSMARTLLANIISRNIHNQPVVCFLYCCCNREPRGEIMGSSKFTLRDGTPVDISADSGIFQFDQQKSTYTLYGVPAGRATTKINGGAFMTGLLGGFRLEPSPSLGQL